MLVGFEHESAELAEAQPAITRTVLVLPSESEAHQHELTHVLVAAGVVTAYVSRAKRANSMSQDLASSKSSPQITCSWVRMERSHDRGWLHWVDEGILHQHV